MQQRKQLETLPSFHSITPLVTSSTKAVNVLTAAKAATALRASVLGSTAN